MLVRTTTPLMLRVCGVVAVSVVAACGGGGEAEGPTPPVAPTLAETTVTRRPIVVDTDLGADDVIALAILLRSPTLDVRAVTVSGTGLVHCPAGLRHVRSLLMELGAERPVGCGRGDPGSDGLSFPALWRASSDELYGLELRAADVDGAVTDAATVMSTAITSSPTDVTIVALGPWTNLEDLVARHPEAVRSIAGIHAMAGAIDVAGNVEVTGEPVAEWNVRADPSAFATMVRTDIPIALVPLDATNAVPLSPAFLDRLADDRSAAGADLAWRLLSRNPFLMSGGQYLWDELAAIALVDPTLVRFERLRVRVDTAEPHAGRVVRSGSGREIKVALYADGTQAVNAILDALGGEP